MSSFNMPSLASMKSAVDELRAQVIPKNETEKRVYEALSSKNWGASTTMLNEIASDSFDYDKYNVIMKVVWDIIDSQGSSWKQVFKAVSLLEFLVKNGAERSIEECRDHMRTLRRLQDYNYFEGTADKGSGTREKSKQLVELLGNNDYIREEREKAQRLRNKFTGVGSDGQGSGGRRSSYGGGGRNDRYGGSGSNDRYGGSGSNDRYGGSGNNDRYGDDRYGGSGSNDRYGGSGSNDRYDRYGGSGSNDRYGSEGGGGYSEGGIPSSGRKSGSGSGGRRSTYDDSRDNEPRGGGSYSSSRSGGYSDEPSYSSQSSQAKKLANTPEGSGGGKIKIKIKGANSPKKSTAPKQEETDFFQSSTGGDDFFQDSTPAPTTNNTFDAFGDSSTSNNDFDGFQSAPVQQQPVVQQQTFDAFQTAPVQQQQQQPPQQQFDMFQSAPVQQQQQQQQQPVQQFDMFQSAPVQQQNFVPPVQQSTDNDFGDFEGPPQTTAPAPMTQLSNVNAEKKPENKLSGLVNLDNLSLGTPSKSTAGESKSQQSANNMHSSTAFAGLDGFSKTTQPMHMGSAPAMQQQMGGGMRPNGLPHPMGGQMGGQQMGMMGGQQMGGQQMGGQMNMMGGQMGGQQMNMGQQMGGMNMMGGQPQMGGMNMMGGQPQMGGMNMMGGQQQMGGMNMMGGQQQMGQQNQNQNNQFGGAFNF